MRWNVHYLVVALGMASCGRLHFEDVRGDSLFTDTVVDAPPPLWDGNFTLSPPELVPELNSAELDLECYVVPDGSRIYFASFRSPPTLGFRDFFYADRTSIDAPFGSVVHMPELSTAAQEGGFSSVDGLRAYYWSFRGAGEPDILTAARATTSEPFRDGDAVPIMGLDTATPEYDPWQSHDLERLYYVLQNPATDLHIADRVSPVQFTPRGPLSELNGPTNDDNPTLASDERFIVFASDRNGPMGSFDLFYARRADRTLPFEPPQPLPVVNTTASEHEPCLSQQGELFFSSDRPGGMGGFDIYRSRFIPL